MKSSGVKAAKIAVGLGVIGAKKTIKGFKTLSDMGKTVLRNVDNTLTAHRIASRMIIGKKYNTIKDNVQDKKEQLKYTAVDTKNRTIKGVKSFGEGTKKRFKNATTRGMEYIKSKKEDIKAGISLYSEAARDKLSNMKKNVQRKIGDFKEDARETKDDIRYSVNKKVDKVKSSVNKIKEGVNVAKRQVVDKSKDAKHRFEQRKLDTMSKALEVGDNFSKKLLGRIQYSIYTKQEIIRMQKDSLGKGQPSKEIKKLDSLGQEM